MSFKAAASELGVTPTAISHQVQMLEEICGRELFRRRPLALTTAGAELFPVLRTGLDSFATTIASITGGTDRLPLRSHVYQCVRPSLACTTSIRMADASP